MGDRAANRALFTNDDLDNHSENNEDDNLEEEDNMEEAEEAEDDVEDAEDAEEAEDVEEAEDGEESTSLVNEATDSPATDNLSFMSKAAPSTLTMSSRRSLLQATAKAARRIAPSAPSAPASVVTTGTATSKSKKARTKSPAINKMTSDENLIARMLEIKNIANGEDKKWSSKSQEIDFKMKCVEHVDKLKGMGWSDRRIAHVFPDFAPFIEISDDDTESDE